MTLPNYLTWWSSSLSTISRLLSFISLIENNFNAEAKNLKFLVGLVSDRKQPLLDSTSEQRY